jgi:hypothetical protein
MGNTGFRAVCILDQVGRPQWPPEGPVNLPTLLSANAGWVFSYIGNKKHSFEKKKAEAYQLTGNCPQILERDPSVGVGTGECAEFKPVRGTEGNNGLFSV